MNALQLIGLAMLAIEGSLLWLRMGYLPVSALTLLIAIAGCWRPLQRDWGNRKRRLADAAVVLIYFLLWWVYFQHDDQRSQLYQPNMTLAGALGLMMLQAIRFYWRAPGGLTGIYPLFGALALACAGDVYLTGMHWKIFYTGAMVYGVLTAIYYARLAPSSPVRATRWRAYKYAALALCLLLSLGLATGTATILDRSETVVGNWLMKSFSKMHQVALGNSQRIKLGNMTDLDGEQAERIALQIAADDSPGYLRGQVYGEYGASQWVALPAGEPLAPVTSAPPPGYVPAIPDAKLFHVAPAGDPFRSITVYPARDIKRAVFTPGSTAWVALAAESLRGNAAGTVETVRDLDGRAYQAVTATPPAPEPLTADELALYTALPPDVGPRIAALSASVCGELTSPLRKAGAVAQYFTGHYNYSLDFQPPMDVDPLSHFLFSSPLPDAHCEYFATGATLLLRAAGVPARYVTGVAVWERHPFADFWVARNRDAHAWCEAWDPERGWFLVEATPAGGLPEAARGDGTSPVRDFTSLLTLQFRRLVDALRQGAWQTAGAAIVTLLAGAVSFLRERWWIVGVVGVLLALFWFLRRYFRRRNPRPAVSADETVRRLAGQLQTMDRLLARRHRIARPRHRTLHAFANEVETALGSGLEGGRIAAWYRAWAEARYRPKSDPADVDRLEQERHALEGETARRR